MPSKFTIELQNGLRKSLPFEDKRDFKENKKGFIAAPDYKQIKAGRAKLVGDRKPYDQLKNMLVQFSMGFEILPGTKPVEAAASAKNPFKQEPPAVNTITD